MKLLNKVNRVLVVMAFVLGTMVGAMPVQAQTAVNTTTSVPLSFSVAQSLTMNCTTPTFTVSGNTATGSTITCNSSWNLPTGQGYGLGICVAQWFTTATPFGASGPANSAVSSTETTGSGTFGTAPSIVGPTTCTSVFPSLGAQYFGPNLYSSATEPVQGSRTDTDVITINLAGLGVGTYSGTLNFAIGLQ